MKNRYLHGFTIIELLIVIAIISILASISIPSYQRYLARARFSEVMLAAEPFKTAISLALQDGVPASELTLGSHDIPSAPPSTKNLDSLKVTNGVITATGTRAAGGYTYILTPDDTGSIWAVDGTCVAAGACKS